MRKKKSPQIVKVEKINELHTNTNITNESILNKESLLNKNNVSNKEETAFKPLLLTTTKGQLDTIIEEKNNFYYDGERYALEKSIDNLDWENCRITRKSIFGNHFDFVRLYERHAFSN